jgi:hypothetical protein
MAIELVPCDDWPAFAPMATENAFCNVEPARDPREMTVLRREIVLVASDCIVIDDAFTVEQLAVLNVSTFVQDITLF